MKVMIAAGGTGGHIYPGIAVASEIIARDSNSRVLFVGTQNGLENKLVPAAEFELQTIPSAGLKNVGLAGKLKGLLLLPKSFIAARSIIKKFSPDVVVGAGGYVSGPVVLMASMLRIPTLVLESNALPGFTNRRLAPFISQAALSFEVAKKFFGSKGIVTGNPVRREFFDIEKKQRENERVQLLVFGGSQGARAINYAVLEALPHLKSFQSKLRITHQTGEPDFENIKQGYGQREWLNAEVRPYISEMFSEFARADLVVCRAGATTCAEIAAAGKAAIMVPLPTAADDHQRKNAEALSSAGAARMILQKDLNGKSLAREITSLIENPDRISEMENAARKLARRDAAQLTVDIIERLAAKKSRN